MLQPECGGKEGPALKSRGMQASHAGEDGFHIITGVPRALPKVTLPLSFKGIAACLLMDLHSLAPIKAPPEPRQPDTLVGPTVTTVYATQIVQDEATRATYIDMVTTLVERVALRNSSMVCNLLGSTMEDITNLP